jgi:retinol-binding protein 3
MRHLCATMILLLCGITAWAQELVLNEQIRREVIEGALSTLKTNYVFPETAQKMDAAVRERLARGEYDKIGDPKSFAATLEKHLQEISRDKHLLIYYRSEKIPVNSGTAVSWIGGLGGLARENYGFAKVELLEGNIGYLELRRFAPPEVAADTAAAAMNFLHNTDGLIIDLRQNGGGAPPTVALLSSYFFEQPTHLATIHWRPEKLTREFRTSETVKGKRYGDKPIWVLTSQQTFSAAELFAFVLKHLKGAVIVGATTGGGANGSRMRRLNDHFGMLVPEGQTILPFSKTTWDGTGVQADLAVPASDALRAAHIKAVRNLIERTTDQTRKTALQDTLKKLDPSHSIK